MIEPDHIMALALPRVSQQIEWRDCILYALGIGIGLDPLDESELPYVDERRLKVTPTMANVMGYPGFWMQDERFGLDHERTVHGEHAVRLHRPLPSKGKVIGISRIVGLVDKGKDKGALIYVEREIRNEETKEHIATITQTVFCRGDGGFGGTHGQIPSALQPCPERDADLSIDLPTSPQGALIYRLSGDFNPLHYDPQAAQRAGFERPILHGLATFGLVGHGLVKLLCNGRPEQMREMKGRFSSPVFPGETVRVEVWNTESSQYAFRAWVPARNTIVMTHGNTELIR